MELTLEDQNKTTVNAEEVGKKVNEALAEEMEIDKERKEARENFSSLISLVNERYQGPESALSPEEQKCFARHNEDILNLCVERGIQKGLDKKDLKILEVATVLHDLNKADKPSAEFKDVPNYVLVNHGEMAAGEVKNILATHPEILTNILGAESSEEDKNAVISKMETAIRCHMGPHPGFMDGVLANANKKLEEKGLAQVGHPRPPEGDAVAETLLAADMCSLASVGGREKVLAIRSAVPFFRGQDVDLSEKYKVFGKYTGNKMDLTPGEAALLSAFDSATQARDMLGSQSDRDWVDLRIKESMEKEYTYIDRGPSGEEIKRETVKYGEAIQKRESMGKLEGKSETQLLVRKRTDLLDGFARGLKIGSIPTEETMKQLEEQISEIEHNIAKARRE